MSDLVDGLKADPYDRVYSNRYLLKRISRYLKPRVPLIVTATVATAIGSVLTSAVPMLISKSIDQVEAGDINQLARNLSALILVAVLLAWGMNYIRQRIAAALIGGVVYQLQTETFDAALKKGMFFFDRNAVGKIVSRITADTEAFGSVITLALNAISQLLLVAVIGSILFSIDLSLALVALGLSPVVIVTALAFRRIARRATQETQRIMATVNANIHESMRGISVAKCFGQEEKLAEEFRQVNELSYQVYTRQGLIYSSILPILNVLSGFGSVVILYFGGMASIRGDISPGDWYFFIYALGLLWIPLTQIASFWSLFQLGLAASERIFAFVDSDDSIKQIDHTPVEQLEGRIDFKTVAFRYTEEEPVLDDFGLSIASGEKIAIVGHTGAGKSSIAKLIARFYEFQEGELLIDGKDIRTLDIRGYCRHLGIVPQHPFLFSGSVRDNIEYVRPGASETAIRQAACQVAGGDWLCYLPEGLDTMVGENGKGLSMGQRQIIALARVFLKDPSLIIFDEATASIDPLAEAQIQETLDRLVSNRTVITIAHRLSTVKNASRIIAIDKGKIVEQGKYGELLAKGGYFAELYDTYFRHQEEIA